MKGHPNRGQPHEEKHEEMDTRVTSGRKWSGQTMACAGEEQGPIIERERGRAGSWREMV